MTRSHTIRVQLGERSYDVVVGSGVRSQVFSALPSTARRALVITQDGIPFAIADDLKSAGLSVSTLTIGDGEEHKSLSTIEAIMVECANIGLTRNDVIVGVGGGMVTDVAGFAASLWHRGIAAVHVSTTLVGMVDAAIGGKTGVNLSTGKNLVGSFWQPRAVFCDTDALASLSPQEIRCGHGEMAKYHFLTGDNLLALELAERIARCVQIKADIVGADEREGGRRMLLNYGHTLAHALEIATDFSLAHGEAVAIGLVYAAHVAHQLGRIDQHRVDQHRAVVTGEYGLSCALPAGVSHEQLIQLMHGDKKALTGLTFVLDGPRGVEPVTSVDLEAVRRALHSMEVR
ncbi:MAG: 3-dehydroquinate synthase [Acidimicrobium sp. BACL17 MAG-120823-bin42]|jgi:5-deoxy-5-amino-3-dehydroquinate synthase|nr:MAG: 3-dehydroquinate synthase [Acidimicrobium sp. BACL17 MAG-120924-bin0]KRO42836.1 MAG: 3-dehydroquinate synthase [Acidimicrobium sp. BACL17 MAG-120823-bin42]